MSVPATLFPELEQLIRNGSAARRAQILRRVAMLFAATAANLNGGHVALFDDVMCALTEGVQSDLLAELAQLLAPIPNSPARVMLKLARSEDIDIAGPVLRQAFFADYDLMEIAETKSQTHLLALASRESLDEALSEILVTRGDRDVVLALVNNTQAKFSENVLSQLVKRAEDDILLAEKLLMRRDTNPRFFRELWIRAYNTDPPQTDAGITASSLTFYDIPQRDSEHGEAEIAAFAKAGHYEETMAALARVCSVPSDVIHRLMSGNRLDPLLILGRAAGFSWDTVSALIRARPGTKPSEQVLSAASNYYHRLTATAANRVMRFWQMRHGITA